MITQSHSEEFPTIKYLWLQDGKRHLVDFMFVKFLEFQTIAVF